MQSKKKMIKRAKAKQKQEDSKLLPLKLILNWIEPVLVNEELANIDKLPAVIHKVENDRE